MKKLFTCAAFSVVILSFLLHIKTLANEHNSLDAHVHGLSEITIAIDKHTLEVEIKSPAINLVGFEHQAHNQQDIAKVNHAKSLLSQNDTVLSLTGGHCQLLNLSIDMSSLLTTHLKEKSEGEEHTHVHKHAEHLSEENNHREVIASYMYHCKRASTLSTITVNAFKLFPDILQMQAMWITENQQGAVTLTPNNSIINFK